MHIYNSLLFITWPDSEIFFNACMAFAVIWFYELILNKTKQKERKTIFLETITLVKPNQPRFWRNFILCETRD